MHSFGVGAVTKLILRHFFIYNKYGSSRIPRILLNPEIYCTLDSWNPSIIVEIPFDLKPRDFFNFAIEDLDSHYEHHLINGLSNIKRAIDCQIDSILYTYGLFKKSKKENWYFPKKIDILNNLGIVSPRILTKINRLRNLLEHQYEQPEEEKVTDALDIAELFIEYTDRFLNPIMDFEVRGGSGPDDTEKLFTGQILINHKHNQIIFYSRDYDEKKKKIKKIISKKIIADSEEYLPYTKNDH